jgi:hypothetical protein
VLTPLDIRFRPLTDEEQEDLNRARAEDAIIEEAAGVVVEMDADPPANE